jgi:hypothetical protein
MVGKGTPRELAAGKGGGLMLHCAAFDFDDIGLAEWIGTHHARVEIPAAVRRGF